MKIEINCEGIKKALKITGKYVVPVVVVIAGGTVIHKQSKKISELEGKLAEKERQNQNLSRENNNLAYQTGKKAAELEQARREAANNK